MKKKALEITKTKSGEPSKAILYIDEELSFINGTQIKNELLESHKEFDQLVIQANIVHIDLTGVQLLIAINRFCIQNNKTLTSNIKMSNELKKLITLSGFKELIY